MPLADYQAYSATGCEVERRYPTGPETTPGLWAQRNLAKQLPPSERSLSGLPQERPLNWLTYLLLHPIAFALFSVPSALLGWMVGILTTGLPPPARKNLRWALGLLVAFSFFLPSLVSGGWVRPDPGNSGVFAVWAPHGLPILELVLLAFLEKKRRRNSHNLPSDRVS